MPLFRDLSALEATEFDIVVIGGGSNGAAVARDAALRGLKVALVEKEDFGYGTVSRSTRLIHGGLRYLELLDFGLVREGLREREILLRTAPHLVHPLRFLTPVYRHYRVTPLKLRVGMWLYDALSWDKSMPRHRFLRASEVIASEPLLNPEGLLCGFLYYDGQVPMPERLCLEAALQAAAHGAVVANHARAEALEHRDQSFELTVTDLLGGRTYRVRSRSVVNATGPWADELNAQLLGRCEPRLRRTKGIHLLVPRLCQNAVVILAQSDGRLFFAVPWGAFSLIGTTDTDFHGDLDTVKAHDDEVQYLLRETRRVFPQADLSRVYLTTAGVRPLVRDPGAKKEGDVSRKHAVVHHDGEGVPGFFSVFGGKITNMRSVAEETVDQVVRYLGRPVKPCSTRREPFPGGAHPNLARLRQELKQQYARGSDAVGEHQVDYLVDLYGSMAPKVLEMARQDASLARPLSEDSPALWAQLAYGVEREWVCTTADFLLRRTPLGLGPGMAAHLAGPVAEWIGRRLGRDPQEVARDMEEYQQTVERMQHAAADGRVRRLIEYPHAP